MAIRVVESFSNKDFDNRENDVLVLVRLLGIEKYCKNDHKGNLLVLGVVEKKNNKDMYVWLLLEDSKINRERILGNRVIYVEGIMDVSYMLGSRYEHTPFVIPKYIEDVETSYDIEETDEFYLNYTIGNRVVLDGLVDEKVWREYIPTVKNYVTRFGFKFKVNGEDRKIFCTVWDTVNKNKELKIGKKLKIVGSFSLLKKDRGLVIEEGNVIKTKKNIVDSNVIVVQKMIEKE